MQSSVCHLFESASNEQMARDLLFFFFLVSVQNNNKKVTSLQGTDSARQLCSLDEVPCQNKQNTIGLPISLTNIKPFV